MNKYIELIQQTFNFPNEEYKVVNGELFFKDIRMMDLIEKYDSPLKVNYLPEISNKISLARKWFSEAFKKNDYKANYTYAYCTKSSHFSFVIEEVLKNNAQIETSSAFDISIINSLYKQEKLTKDTLILCNGFKRPLYIKNIIDLIEKGFNCVPILDNIAEFDEYKELSKPYNIGIRAAADEEPNFNFYTSRLGIAYNKIIPFVEEKILSENNISLTTLHFFINTGIKDNAYYWNELNKFVELYCKLKKICPQLKNIDIGGGFPIKTWLGFEYDYPNMVEQIVFTIKDICTQNNIEEPNIITEFGTFTVGESGSNLYSVLDQKLQNDKELWYMIDSSFITTLPDTWGTEQRFILLPLNLWENDFHNVNIGGLTCDSLDYYNAETHSNKVFLPKINEGETLYIGLFNTGAYQEALGGYGGIQHCLIPSPKQIIINNRHDSCIFSDEQSDESMLTILGFKK